MPGQGLLAGFAALRCGLRRACNQLASRLHPAAVTSAAVSPGSSALDEDGRNSAERARLLRKACVHGQVAVQISEIMQGNVAKRENLRQRLAGLRPPGDQAAPGSATGTSPPSASLRHEIEVLDRIIAWHMKTIGWHQEEERRLRDQATRV
jgi:hypothetical protein